MPRPSNMSISINMWININTVPHPTSAAGLLLGIEANAIISYETKYILLQHFA
jgi:hypothetical protein